MNTQLRIKRLYNVIDGVDYISQYVTGFKRVGMSFKACCPFHSEKTPSFTIYPKNFLTKNGPQDHDSFYCFGCDAGGDIIKFYELLNNVNRITAIEKLEIEFGLSELDNNSEYLINKLKQIKLQPINLLSFSEVNLLVSITCRKYLEWIKNKHIIHYQYEKKLIDHYYRYIDYMLQNCTNSEANELYKKINNKLQNRKKQFK